MKPWRKSLAIVLCVGLFAGGWFFGSNLIRDAQFAHAQAQVEISRQQLKGVEDLSASFREVGKVIDPSVVHITVRRKAEASSVSGPDRDMLRRFFPDLERELPPGFEIPREFRLPQPREFFQQGTGSGVIMEVENGQAFIITNNHVVGNATEMTITLHDGRQITDAKVIGTDPKTDVAVIQVKADRLIPAKWGNSDELQRGDWVLAFGSPLGYTGSMTAGIVSGLDRQTNMAGGAGILGPGGYENFIQTDAAINPGNSGGPLVNMRGEVIGINTAIASRSGGFQGIGFAIPSNQAKFVYEALRKHGRVTRGWLGVEIADVQQEAVRERARAMGFEGDRGVFVSQIFRNTPAAGLLEPGDVITRVNDHRINNINDLRNIIAATAPGTEVAFTVVRDGKEQKVNVTLGEQPDDLASAGGPVRDLPRRDATPTADQLGLRLADPTRELLRRHGLPEGTSGAMISRIDPGSLAAQAGLQVGDVITRIGRTEIGGVADAEEALSEASLEDGIRLMVTNRRGERLVFIRRSVE